MYHSLIVERAMKLRNEQTKEERKLWYVFLNKYPIKIRRQYPLDYYIADFFCREARLIIEIDGIQHQLESGLKYDEKRTKFIESMNYKVVRFNNTDIKNRFDDVCYYIDLIIKERLVELRKEEMIIKLL